MKRGLEVQSEAQVKCPMFNKWVSVTDFCLNCAFEEKWTDVMSTLICTYDEEEIEEAEEDE